VLVNCTLRFVSGDSDAMTALVFQVADIAAVRDAAKAKGYAVAGDAFLLGGVYFRLAV
jgi:cystathionine beta-lyase/cystathionine gamma-synthase